MSNPPTPEAVAVILAAERGRLSAFIDGRIASWEQFQDDYPDHPGLDILLAELDYIRSVIDVTKNKARHPGD